MPDKVLDAFLTRQREEGMALAASSDLLELKCLDPQHYVARFLCEGLVRRGTGDVEEASGFEVGIFFSADHLRRVEPAQLVTWFTPWEIYHPNIRPPFCCLGRSAPGISLVEVLYQIYEIVTYQKVTMREDDALNHAACSWARENTARFPVDRRPLKRRPLNLRTEVRGGAHA
jgi:hypothetical protein